MQNTEAPDQPDQEPNVQALQSTLRHAVAQQEQDPKTPTPAQLNELSNSLN